jgi:hypothetical protein
MEISTVKRLFFWAFFVIFMIVLMILMTSSRMSVGFRILITLLLALFSAYFRFQNKYSFVSIITVFFAAMIAGVTMAASIPQFWMFTFLYVIAFFISAEALERDILGL